MTDKTDIAALRSEAANIIGLLTTEGHQSFTLDKAADFFDDVFRLLEAERQRAENWSVSFENERLRADKLAAHIEALKGDQVPVALVDERQGSGGFCLTQHGRRLNLPHGTELFTAPQKPVLHPDTKRMDWLVSQHVEVRTPMVYGSHARFVAQCDSDDCEEYHTTLREQIDAAIDAAGGWVCTSDERLMQDMSGIVVEPNFREISNSSTGTFRENLETSTNCPKCGGSGSYHCPQMLGTVECECGGDHQSSAPAVLRDVLTAVSIGGSRTELIDALTAIKPKFGAPGSRDVDVRAAHVAIDKAIEKLSNL